MSKDMHRRLSALETGPGELSPEIRQWLGEPITEVERATIVPAAPLSRPEQEAFLREMPTHLREWFDNRLYSAA